MEKIRGIIKGYAWGKPEPDSLVRMVGNLQGCPGALEEATCAEIWWGTHKDGTAQVIDSETPATLKQYYSQGDLSFLLKVRHIYRRVCPEPARF